LPKMVLWAQSNEFNIDKIPDLTGKVAIITGGTAGLGLASAIELAYKGAHVIITARTSERGEEAMKLIRQALESRKKSDAKVEFGIAENENLRSVTSFVDWFLKKSLPLHILMLNAGVAFVPFRLIEGVESTLFINQVPHHLMTKLLLPKLRESAPARVVIVSSDAHKIVSSISLDAPSAESYSGMKSYGNSKLANILFARALQRRLKDDERIYVNAIHPGAVATNIVEKTYAPDWLKSAVNFVLPWLAKSPEYGALTQLYAATSPEVEERGYRGQYFVPTAQHKPNLPDYATDEAAQEQLWEWTEKTVERILAAAPASE
jgi:NAD(P)-dependent dehydrogenase (short-subunit alcohol dehydrogenase family)